MSNSKKTIIVGVCGGIAAYKVVGLVSLFKKNGYNVRVAMTQNATKFVTPLTFKSVSNNDVVTDMFQSNGKWDIEHISYAKEADLIVIAPATANIIGKTRAGIADDFLTTTLMATKAPILFIPAMNHNMYENKIVQENIKYLISKGYNFLEPDYGTMACNTVGRGRLPEIETIFEASEQILSDKKGLENYKVLITAGPTIENIDSVRFISNKSSGKMGYSIAKEAKKRGAEVKLISGPVHLKPPVGISIINVESAEQMYENTMANYREYDIIFMVAAVADYKVENPVNYKIKKSDENVIIDLVKNKDIAYEMGKIKKDKILIGFSAETENVLKNAQGKLDNKNLNMIIANDVSKEGAGFNVDTNIINIIKQNGEILEFPLMHKSEVANVILDEVEKLLK